MAQEAFAKLIEVIGGLAGGTQYNGDDAFTPGDKVTVAGVVRKDVGGTLAGADGDYTVLQVDASGNLRVALAAAAHGKTILSTGGSASTSGNNTLIAADATSRIKVCGYALTTTSTTAMTCIFQDGASGTELWRVILQAPASVSTGANLAVSAPAWLFATTANVLLNLNLSSANAVHWAVSYFKEA